MRITVYEFYEWGMELYYKVRCRDGKEYFIFVLPAPLCGMRFVNEVRYFPGQVFPTERSLRRNNMMVRSLKKHNYFNKYISHTFFLSKPGKYIVVMSYS